jgi:hypothetical protein
MKRMHGLDVPQTLEEVCDPQRLALVVHDGQSGILFTDAASFGGALNRKTG